MTQDQLIIADKIIKLHKDHPNGTVNWFQLPFILESRKLNEIKDFLFENEFIAQLVYVTDNITKLTEKGRAHTFFTAEILNQSRPPMNLNSFDNDDQDVAPTQIFNNANVTIHHGNVSNSQFHNIQGHDNNKPESKSLLSWISNNALIAGIVSLIIGTLILRYFHVI